MCERDIGRERESKIERYRERQRERVECQRERKIWREGKREKRSDGE